MKKEIAKKWVKALRSGKYKQGKGYLKQFNNKHEPKHCCLGVLCELYNDTMKKNHKKSLYVEEMVDGSDGTDFIRFDLSDGGLPKAVRQWAGIACALGDFTVEKDNYYIEECLADLNDSGKKFSTIANIIEKNVENL
jgi:hypothetical protein